MDFNGTPLNGRRHCRKVPRHKNQMTKLSFAPYSGQMSNYRSRRSRRAAELSDRLRQFDWRRLHQRLTRLGHRLWQWLLRYLFRTSRAFLAGVGAFTLLVFGLLRSAGIEQATIVISGVLLLSLAGGVIGVAIQRYYKRFALFRRVSEALAPNVDAVEEAT